MLHDLIHLGRIDKSTLHTGDRSITGIEAVAATDQLLCTLRIEDSTRVNHTLRPQRNTRRDIRFDDTRDDVYRRTLGSQDHVHSYGTRLLGDSRNRCLHLFACLHDKISVLIDDDDDIGQVLMVQAIAH